MVVNLQAAQIGFIMSAKEKIITGQGTEFFFHPDCDFHIVKEKSHPLKPRFTEKEFSSLFCREGEDLRHLFAEAIETINQPHCDKSKHVVFEIRFEDDNKLQSDWEQLQIMGDVCEQATSIKETWQLEARESSLEGDTVSSLTTKAFSVNQLIQIRKLGSTNNAYDASEDIHHDSDQQPPLLQDEISLALRYWSGVFSQNADAVANTLSPDFNGEIIYKRNNQQVFAGDIIRAEALTSALQNLKTSMRINEFSLRIFKDIDNNLCVKYLFSLKESDQDDITVISGSHKWAISNDQGKLEFISLLGKENISPYFEPTPIDDFILVERTAEDTSSSPLPVLPLQQDGWLKWVIKKLPLVGSAVE